jgi:magnesium-protoporphyrin IX monomethyl ester (oxidative) cyclase
VRVFLIQPAALLSESYALQAKPFLALGLANLAAILREAGHDVRVLDAYTEGWDRRGLLDDGTVEVGLPEEEVAARVRRFQPHIVGFSMPFGAQKLRVASLSRWVKAIHPEIFVVCGGNYPTAAAADLLSIPSIDAVLLGEGEVALLEMIAALESGSSLDDCTGVAYRSRSGSPIIRPAYGPCQDLDCLPFPALDLLPIEKYFRFSGERRLPLLLTRGCSASCSDCSSRALFGKSPHSHSAAYQLQQIEQWIELYNVRDFAFYDHAFFSHSDRTAGLVDLLIEKDLKIHWTADCCLDGPTPPADFFLKMKRAGADVIRFDVGSGSRRVLSQILKRGIDLHGIEEIIAQALSVEIKIAARFQLGLPGETVEEIYETLNFAWKLRSRGAQSFAFDLATPYAGTLLRDQALQMGCRLPQDDLSLDPHRAVLHTEEFTALDIAQIRDTAQREFSSRGLVYNIRRRLGDNLRAPARVEPRYFASVAPVPRPRQIRPFPLRADRLAIESN